jgi:hypothetical protein
MARKSPRTQAIQELIAQLEKQLGDLQHQVRSFKYRHQKLVDEQTILKRKRAEVWKLLRALRDNEDAD